MERSILLGGPSGPNTQILSYLTDHVVVGIELPRAGEVPFQTSLCPLGQHHLLKALSTHRTTVQHIGILFYSKNV